MKNTTPIQLTKNELATLSMDLKKLGLLKHRVTLQHN